MARLEIVRGLIFADRTEWVTNTALPRRGARVDRDERTHVFIHHTVTPDSDHTKNEWESEDEIFARMRSLQTIRPDLGLDVPYNFVAFLLGGDRLMVCEGRGEDRSGAHTRGHNYTAIGVSFAGNFHDYDVDRPSLERRVDLLSAFLGWLKYDASHPDYGSFAPMTNLGSLKPEGREVWAHRDVKASHCPGRHLMAVLDRITFERP